jgi:hypothetical protein
MARIVVKEESDQGFHSHDPGHTDGTSVAGKWHERDERRSPRSGSPLIFGL